MTKKALSKVLILLLVLGLVFSSGCKSKSPANISKDNEKPDVENKEKDNKDDDNKASTDDEEGYTLPIVEEPITLKFLKRDINEPGVSFNNDTLPLLWQEFEKKTNIKIKFDAVPGSELSEVVQLRLSARQDVPDIIEISGSQDGTHLTKHYADNSIISINEYIDKYAPNIKAVFEKHPGYKRAVTLPDGSVCGLGSVRATNYKFRTQAIRYDWLEQLDIEMPKTPEDLISVAKAFINADLGETGKAIGISGHGNNWKEIGHAWGLHYVTGDGWTEKDGKVIFEPVTEEYQDFLKFLNRCVKEGVFPPDWATVDSDTNKARIIGGQSGIDVRFDAQGVLSNQDPESSMKKENPEADWRLIPPLDGPYGKAIVVKEPIAQRWRTIVVTSANKYPAETVKWLDYVAFSEEGQLYNNYGIEDLTYKIENEKIVRIPPSISGIDGNKPREDGSWMGIGYLPQIETDELAETTYAHLNLPDDNPGLLSIKACWPQIEEPFVPPIPGVEEGKRLSILLTDIGTYVEEMFYKFVSGEISIEKDFDKYVKQLYSIGLNEVLDVYQTAYDSLK